MSYIHLDLRLEMIMTNQNIFWFVLRMSKCDTNTLVIETLAGG